MDEIVNNPDARVRSSEFFQNRKRAIRAAIVHAENIEIPVCLVADALQSLAKIFFCIIYAKCYGD